MIAAGAQFGGGGDAQHRDRHRRVGGGSVSQLALTVEAPTPDGAVVDERARRVADPDLDLGGVGEPADDDGRIGVGGGSVAETPVGVEAPAPTGAVGQHRADLEVAGAGSPRRPSGRSPRPARLGCRGSIRCRAVRGSRCPSTSRCDRPAARR